MLTDIAGRVVSWADLKPGDLFARFRSAPEFALRVALPDMSDTALNFTHHSQQAIPWISAAPMNGPLISFGAAMIQIDWRDAVSTTKAIDPPGSIMAHGENMLISGTLNYDEQKYFNLATGLSVNPNNGAQIFFAKWRCGYMKNENFEELFSFPLPASATR